MSAPKCIRCNHNVVPKKGQFCPTCRTIHGELEQRAFDDLMLQPSMPRDNKKDDE